MPQSDNAGPTAIHSEPNLSVVIPNPAGDQGYSYPFLEGAPPKLCLSGMFARHREQSSLELKLSPWGLKRFYQSG